MKYSILALLIITPISILDMYAAVLQSWQPDFIKQFIFGPFPFTQIYFNFIGFFIPLVISIVSLLSFHYRDNKPEKRRAWLIWTVVYTYLFAIFLFISYFYFPFEFIRSHSGGGENSILFAITLVMLVFAYNASGDSRAPVLLSYPLFFFVGLSSDVIATNYFEPGRMVFGGAGIYDGDFLYPLLFGFVLFSWFGIMLSILEKRKAKKKPT